MSIEWDIEELICLVCGKSEEEKEQIINNSEVDDILFEKYGIDFDAYSSIVKDLLPFTPIVKTALGENSYHAFVNNGCCVVKVKADK